MQLKWRGVELRLFVGDHNRSAATVDLPLLKAVAREHRWFDEISTGKLSLVEPPVYQPFEPRARFRSFHLSSLCGPGSLAGISKIGLSRSTHMAPSEFETERNFIGRGPMGDIWLSLVRCAASNREEGLEQEFNSLHAQREACEAFIKSQAGEGWRLIMTAYDDGGLSGATMERPEIHLNLRWEREPGRARQDNVQRSIEIEQARSRDRQTRCSGSRPTIGKQNRGRIRQRDVRSGDAGH